MDTTQRGGGSCLYLQESIVIRFSSVSTDVDLEPIILGHQYSDDAVLWSGRVLQLSLVDRNRARMDIPTGIKIMDFITRL